MDVRFEVDGSWIVKTVARFDIFGAGWDRGWDPRLRAWLQGGRPPEVDDLVPWASKMSTIAVKARSMGKDLAAHREHFRHDVNWSDIDRNLTEEQLDDLVRLEMEASRVAKALEAEARLHVETLHPVRGALGANLRAVLLHRWRLNAEGYDSRGRYWGRGQPLFRAENEETGKEAFVRALTRQEAAFRLGIPKTALRQPAGL